MDNLVNLDDVKLESEQLEAGEYEVSVAKAEVKSTKDSTGEYINAQLKVISGPRKNSVIYTMFNIKNKNPEATAIGKKQLKAFLMAAGMDGKGLKSVSEMNGLKAVAVVKLKPDTYSGGEKASVSYFKPLSASAKALNTDSDLPF